MRCWLIALTLATGSGCADKGNTGTPVLGSCGMAAQLSGDVNVTYTGKEDALCSTGLSSGSGVTAGLSLVQSNVRVGVEVSEVAEGKTGRFAATVSVSKLTNETWRSDECHADFSEHALVDVEASELGELRHYQVTAHGWCDSSLEPFGTAATGVIEIGEFDFRAQVTWND